MPTCRESCQTLAPAAGIVPDSHATCRRHHKPSAQHMCHRKHRRGWQQAGRHRLQHPAWVGSPAAPPPLGSPVRGVPKCPSQEAPGKRRLLFLGRTRFPVAGRAAAAQQAGRPRRQPPAVPHLRGGGCTTQPELPGDPLGSPGSGSAPLRSQHIVAGILGRAECLQPPRFTRVSLEPWRNPS